MNALGYVLCLAAAWVLLWGTASPANVVAGLVVGTVLVLLLPGLRGPRPPVVARPLGVVRLVGRVLVDSIRSNVLLTRIIVAGRREVDSTIVEVDIPVCSDELLTTIASLLAITPGTMPLEVRESPRRLVVHVLHLDPLEASVRSIEDLVSRALDAFGDQSPRGLER